MKRLPKSALVLIFAFYFCAGFFIVFKPLTSYIEKINMRSLENNFDPNYEVLAVTTNDVKILKLDELEDFKRRNPEYSFLIPKGKESYFAEKLTDANEEMIFEIEVEQISQDKQSIRVSSDDIRSVVKNTYEATDKEVFPKTTTWTNWRYTPVKIIAGSIGGAIACLIFFLIGRKYLAF